MFEFEIFCHSPTTSSHSSKENILVSFMDLNFFFLPHFLYLEKVKKKKQLLLNILFFSFIFFLLQWDISHAWELRKWCTRTAWVLMWYILGTYLSFFLLDCYYFLKQSIPWFQYEYSFNIDKKFGYKMHTE